MEAIAVGLTGYLLLASITLWIFGFVFSWIVSMLTTSLNDIWQAIF